MVDSTRPRRRASGRRAGEVTVRSMSTPKPGWTLDAALDLLAQGYALAGTAERTGFHPDHLRGSARSRGIVVSR